MNERTGKPTYIILSLLKPKAIIVGLAIFNFMVFYLSAKEIEGQLFCFGAPWYITPPFSSFPTMLLIAASALFLGRWWSYLLTFALSFSVIYWGVIKTLFIVDAGALVKWMFEEVGILFQVSLAIVLLIWSFVGIARFLRERISWRRAA